MRYSTLNLIDKKLFFVVFFFFTTLIPSAFAQKEQEDSFEQFINAQQNEFDSFVAKQDREFVKMLENNWAQFEGKSPLIRDDVAKPIKAPEVIGKNKKSVPSNLPKVTKPSIALTPEKPTEKQPVDNQMFNINTFDGDKFSKQKPYQQGISMAFFGQSLLLPQVKFSHLGHINQQALTDFWQNSAKKDLSALIIALSLAKQELQLSDWAYWLMIKQYTELNTSNEDSALAAAWFILNQTGYKAQVAFSSGESPRHYQSNNKALVLLMPSKQTLYSVAYFNLNNQRFYQIAGNKSSSITSYQGSFNPKNKELDLSFNKTLLTKPEIKYRQIKFLMQTLKLPYDYQKVRYLSTYPQIDLAYYFKAPIDSITQQGLTEQIPKLFSSSLKGAKTEEENINLLLSFIHHGFPYAIDDQQFGKENYLTLEETLHYEASDCEDRAILFAWLVGAILNQQAVGLSYPGHVSVAIKRAGKLVSADPTYIGAKLGDIMPKYQDTKPELIKF